MGGLSGEYPEFPDIESKLGYHPARWLDCPVGTNEMPQECTAKGLIRGVQTIDHLQLWIKVEEALGRNNGRPRREVMTWIGTRQVEIQQEQQRDTTHDATSTSAHGPSPDTSDGSDDSPEPTEATKPTATDTTGLVEPTEHSHPRCPTCGHTLKEGYIAGHREFWCQECRGFREPASDPPSLSVPSPSTTVDEARADGDTATTPDESVTAATAITDGGAPDPDTPPRCPDCHGELPEETVDDEDDTHWCEYCGTVVRVGGVT